MQGRSSLSTGDTRGVFLRHLATSANVTASAEVAGWDRSTAYLHKRQDEAFAEAWDAALEQATDTLEAEARRRALSGVQKPLVSGGRVVIDPRTGEPWMVNEYSDQLMVTLLKAHRPDKFKDRATVAHTGANGGPVAVISAAIPTDLTGLSEDELTKLYRASVNPSAGD